MTDLDAALAGHPFLEGLGAGERTLLAPYARRLHFRAGEFLAREGHDATVLYLIEAGRVAVEVHVPGRGAVRLQTIAPGEVVGWSWLVRPHRWLFDVRAMDAVDALAIDGEALGRLCVENLELCHAMLLRMVETLGARLAATRLQLLDLYR